MSRIIFFTVLIGIYISMDIYVFQAFKVLFTSRFFTTIYWAITVFFIFSIFRTGFFLQDFSGIRPLWVNLLIGLSVAIFFTKFILTGLFVLYDGGRLLTGLFSWIGDASGLVTNETGFIPKRRKLITGIIGGIVSIPFAGFLYGITKGKYNYEVKQVTLNFPDLPDAFDGFKIVQISDIHSGSYDSYEQVMEGINLVNAQEPDLLVFTGDLVNSDKDEIDPFISAFDKAYAKNGKFSITGNHDYYGIRTNDPVKKQAYWNDFLSKHKQMGFDILMNENRIIQKGNDTIRIVGVENWGKGPFPRHGDLDKALHDVNPDEFTVLLSHDPTHWDEHVKSHEKKVHLTMSGHTHGMQFGLNALGIKWSPIKYRYSKWAGLYEENDQRLYINRGFGFLGFPGRVGMWPEITCIELKKELV